MRRLSPDFLLALVLEVLVLLALVREAVEAPLEQVLAQAF